jgi:hypothetical protein
MYLVPQWARPSSSLALSAYDLITQTCARDFRKSPSELLVSMAPFTDPLLRGPRSHQAYSPPQPSGRTPISDKVGIPRIWNGPLSTTSVDLIAMVVSDSGLASADPEWWNSSILGCVLIGLQPRGGWQIMQRTVQWGQDSLASIFGVSCSKPTLYAYFACSMRNRLEVWDSEAWISPTEGLQEGAEWKATRVSQLKRPTKLIDGSRGGQGFICNLLRPRDGGIYTIAEQARMQLLSVILVAAGLMDLESLKQLKEVMREDFEIGDRLGVTFFPLLVGLVFSQLLAVAFALVVVYAIFCHNLFGHFAPYVIQLCSLTSWAVGAISLLMLGGNPRVKIVETAIPPYIETRLHAETRNGEIPGQETIHLEFGTIHGSVYVSSRGHCVLPIHVVRTICGWDLELQRPMSWKIGFTWSSLFLLISILLQIAGAQVTTLGSESMAIAFLMTTSLARGWGVSGPEEWLIPKWKMRKGTNYGASLLGRMVSR